MLPPFHLIDGGRNIPGTSEIPSGGEEAMPITQFIPEILHRSHPLDPCVLAFFNRSTFFRDIRIREIIIGGPVEQASTASKIPLVPYQIEASHPIPETCDPPLQIHSPWNGPIHSRPQMDAPSDPTGPIHGTRPTVMQVHPIQKKCGNEGKIALTQGRGT